MYLIRTVWSDFDSYDWLLWETVGFSHNRKSWSQINLWIFFRYNFLWKTSILQSCFVYILNLWHLVFLFLFFFYKKKTQYLVQEPTNLRFQSHRTLAGSPFKVIKNSVWTSPLKLTQKRTKPKILRAQTNTIRRTELIYDT
jgi:hypothetical protein